MSDRTLLNCAQVAKRLGRSIDWFYHNGRVLQAEGFPAPVFGTTNHRRWDPVAIDRWLDSKLPPTPQADAKRDALAVIDAELAEQSAELDRRSAALAAGGRRAHA